MIADLLEDCHTALGEGPALFPDGSLHFVDLVGGRVFRRSGWGSALRHEFPYEVSKVLPWRDGYLALTRNGIESFNDSGEQGFVIDVTGADERLRCSDGTVLPHGGIAVGVMDRDMAPGRGHLTVIHPDGHVDTIIEGASVPNGIDVLASGEEVVWVDSPTRTLMRFPIDPNSGSLNPPTPWITLPVHLGVPDGLCADSDGGVWVAMWGGGAVIHVDASGHLDATITVPAEHVTSVAFDFGNALLITTGHVLLNEEEKLRIPGAGGLYTLPHRVHRTRGLPPRVSSLAPGLSATTRFSPTVSRQPHNAPPSTTAVTAGGALEQSVRKDHP